MTSHHEPDAEPTTTDPGTPTDPVPRLAAVLLTPGGYLHRIALPNTNVTALPTTSSAGS